MATHSSTLAWRIPWREEPGGLQSTGSQRPNTVERLSAHTLDETPRLLKSRVLFSKSIFGFSISSHYTVYKNNLKTQSYTCELDRYLYLNMKFKVTF